MKNKFNLVILVLSIGVIPFLSSCEKEESTISSESGVASSDDLRRSKKGSQKSSGDAFEVAIKAVNASEISFSSGDYTFYFYGSTPDHTVSIASYDTSTFGDTTAEISFEILVGSNTYGVYLDGPNDEFRVESYDTLSFNDLSTGFQLNNSSNKVFAVAVLFIYHHYYNYEESLSFSDNGTSDT